MPKPNWAVLLSGDPYALGPSHLPQVTSLGLQEPHSPSSLPFLHRLQTYSPIFPISLAAPLLMFLILTAFSKTEIPNLQATDQYFLSDQRWHQIRNKVHNKCNVLESSQSHFPPSKTLPLKHDTQCHMYET